MLNKNGFVRYWDTTSCAPSSFNEKGRIFVTYDDEESLGAKCKYIDKYNLKGALWEYTSIINPGCLMHLIMGYIKQ